jgi:PAS domain S-box-containing protein
MIKPASRSRILIVDDEPVMRTITESVLSQYEFEVSSVDCAEKALALIDSGNPPDLLLLDVLMPGMNGFDMCRLLRQQARFLHLPIIMLTALDDQASIDQAYRCGATDFITKPLNIPLLPHRVRYLLRSAQAFSELVDSQEILINTQHIALLGNWEMDARGTVVAASRQYLEIVGAPEVPVEEGQLLERVHREDRAVLSRARQEMRAGHSYHLDYRLRSLSDDNAVFHVHEMGFPIHDEHGHVVGASGFTQDITQRVAQEERIRHLAWKDSVTGLNNRTRLIDLLGRDLAGGGETSLAAMFIHVDSVRDISSVSGQDVADAAMKVLAGRIKATLETPPGCSCGLPPENAHAAKLARYDEQSFVIVMPDNTDRDSIRCFAEQIAGIMSQPMSLFNEEFLIKSFIGIAYFPEDAPDILELLRRAMLVASHAARSEDGALVNFFDPEHDREASQRMIIERGLRLALDQGGQLQPYFQPKILAATGEVIGAEVLLRWQHPEMGMVMPGSFIPVAEESGLIHPISEWLLGEVCEHIADWLAMGVPVGCISINLSANSFFQRGLLQFIDEVLARTGVPAGQLIIELTESVLMQDGELASRVIDALRQRGLRISLDDFGTGFSSLGYLNRFGIDEIKIDRSFIDDLDADTTERALVQAVIDLGHALGLQVVAEGVETQSQADLLRQMGCDIFQGFLFARPMPGDEFIHFQQTGKH